MLSSKQSVDKMTKDKQITLHTFPAVAFKNDKKRYLSPVKQTLCKDVYTR